MTGDKRQAPDLLTMRVTSFTHFLQGPAASQYLADMGADVVKVEAPGGSYERRWAAAGRDVGGYGSLYLAANRNMRSIVIDLKADRGREAALTLIENSDVVIENYRPGVMGRLGLGYAAVKAVKPDVIYASATGYGPDGPLSKGPGQDLLAQARAGMVAQTGAYGTRPTPIGNSGIDQHAATLLALGIVGAFVRKLMTGEGTRVEGTLYNACVDFMQEGLVHYFSGGHDRTVLKRNPNLSSWYLEAPYGAYRVKDGAVVVSINTYQKLFDALGDGRLAEAVDLDPWRDRDRCAELLAAVLADMTFDEVRARFEAHGVWYERVQDFEDMRSDPQAAYAEIFRKVPVGDGEATLINHPLRYDGGLPAYRGIPLVAGQDSRAVLGEIGYSQSEIAALIECGAVAAAAEGGSA